MSIEILIQKYGYLALIVGTFLEGETVLVLGGFAAQQEVLVLPYVILAAFLGALCSDQLFFFLGRLKGKRFLDRRPKFQARAKKAKKLLERYHTLVIIGFRFIYGIRNITPFVLGMSNVKIWKFFALNVLAALIWATAIGTAGFFFGVTIVAILKDIKHYERIIILVIVLIVLVISAVKFFTKRMVVKK